MINSLFLFNPTGEVFLEKHWQSPLERSICDPFCEELQKTNRPEDVPCVFSGAKSFLFVVYRFNIFFVAVTLEEAAPLFVYEFLHRIADILNNYLGDVSYDIIHKNLVLVYEVLEEMMDNGFPLCTENNILKEIVKPPTAMRTAMDKVVGQSSTTISQKLPNGQLSNIPWRKAEVWHATNDIYVDIIEKLDCILDRNGTPIVSEIDGSINVNCKLSGVPDLVLSFANSRVFDDISFHPCIRIKRWENERVLSFVPPDGKFKLMGYRVTNGEFPCPLQITPTIKYSGNSGYIDLKIARKHVNAEKNCEKVRCVIPVPEGVSSVSLNTKSGTYTFNPVTREITWDIGKVSTSKMASISGNIYMTTKLVSEFTTALALSFTIPSMTFSNVQVGRLEIFNEKYKPFKGVKYIAQSGDFEVRT